MGSLVFAQAKVLSSDSLLTFGFAHLGEAAFAGFELPLVEFCGCLLVKLVQVRWLPAPEGKMWLSGGCHLGREGMKSSSPCTPAMWLPLAGNVLQKAFPALAPIFALWGCEI